MTSNRTKLEHIILPYCYHKIGKKMQIDFRIKPVHESIIRILDISGPQTTLVLKRIYDLVKNADFENFVKTSASYSNPHPAPWSNLFARTYGEPTDHRDDFDKELEGLLFLGILEKGAEKNDYYQDRITNVFISLSEEGKRIALGLKHGRKIILRPAKTKRSTIFIASAFGKKDVDRVFKEYFEVICSNSGYEAVRVDLSEPINTITEEILRGVINCECMIADLTYARPSVYFEVGFAFGLGINLLLTCRSDHYRGVKEDMKVHFDLEQFKISFWEINATKDLVWKGNETPKDRLTKILKRHLAHRRN